MKKFVIPEYYQSSFIARIKESRKSQDPRKKDFFPTLLDFGPVRFFIARHFGFCYGVENAIEISYRALKENPAKRIFLLSQMIHNPHVNQDLVNKGIRFLMDTEGKKIIDWDELTCEDIVIVPAFGTTIEIENKLKEIGIKVQEYNTTCPFVEKVWKQSQKLGTENFTVIIHGKHKHEETRATFSHSVKNAPSLIIKDISEAKTLGSIILNQTPSENFYRLFEGRFSENFDVNNNLKKVGVVNQTTMLATETQEISDYLKKIMIEKYGYENCSQHFADTRDTLCYATNDNQEATYGLLSQKADLAIVVGGYNSSNTSHIVDLCEEKLPTYFISSSSEIISKSVIHHFNYQKKQLISTDNFLPDKNVVDIILTSGASCPDTLVDEVLDTLLSFFDNTRDKDGVLADLLKKN